MPVERWEGDRGPEAKEEATSEIMEVGMRGGGVMG